MSSTALTGMRGTSGSGSGNCTCEVRGPLNERKWRRRANDLRRGRSGSGDEIERLWVGGADLEAGASESVGVDRAADSVP
jgi:hypothetical protein